MRLGVSWHSRMRVCDRFLHVGSDFSQEAVGRYSNGATQRASQFFPDGLLDRSGKFLRILHRTLPPHEAARHFVNRDDRSHRNTHLLGILNPRSGADAHALAS